MRLDTMFNVPLIQFIRKLVSEPLDVFSHFCRVGVLVEGVDLISVTKSRQTPEITVFLREFESTRRESIFVCHHVQAQPHAYS
jgi:hypothetical protein